jgi:hypothetical protein
LECLAVIPYRTLVLAKGIEGISSIRVSRDESRPESNGFGVVSDGKFMTTQGAVSNAPPMVGYRMPWVCPDHFIKTYNGVFGVSPGLKRESFF